MDRKQFLAQLWQRLAKPALIIAAVFLVLQYFISDTDRIREAIGFSAIIILILLASLGLYSLRIFLEKQCKNTYNMLSENTRKNIRAATRTISFISEFLAGIGLYILWQKDPLYGSVFIILALVMKVRDIIQESRTQQPT